MNLYATRTKNELEETIATQVPELHSSFRTGVSHSWSQHTFQKCQRVSFHGTLFNGFPIRQKYYLNDRECHIGIHGRTGCFCLWFTNRHTCRFFALSLPPIQGRHVWRNNYYKPKLSVAEGPSSLTSLPLYFYHWRHLHVFHKVDAQLTWNYKLPQITNYRQRQNKTPCLLCLLITSQPLKWLSWL